MFKSIILFSLRNKLIVLLAVGGLIGAGIYSATQIPLDAVPDITNNQVQIVSTSPTLAPQEMEQLVTYPLEASMTNIPGVTEVRSISRYGLSVITVVFEEHVPVLEARQYVREQLLSAAADLPAGLTEPELMPITTGLGEIYQYVLVVDDNMAAHYDPIELRTIQDWIVKRQLNGTPGIIETSSFGGFLKQYEVAVDPVLLRSYGLTLSDVMDAIEANNENSGGSYIENGPYSFYIRTEGRVESLEEIGEIFVSDNQGIPIRVKDIADVQIGHAKRYGALTMDGKGEVVGGITLMLKGANSSEVLQNVQDRMEKIRTTLPPGVDIYPYLDRSRLISKTIDTVTTNLVEGGLIVIFVLLMLLGNLRAGLIVASVIPLSMLFALTMMNYFGISANLMSLGAIDFGIVIDGAVIIVEGLLHTLAMYYVGRKLSGQEMDQVVAESTSRIYRAAAFGVLIILVVFIPILTLEGIEGKTFQPMAQTIGFAILGSLILSITYVPVMSSLFLSKKITDKVSISDRIVHSLKKVYQPFLNLALRAPMITIGISLALLAVSLWIFLRMGTEFVPTLEEGDLAVQQSIKPGSSLEESIRTSSLAEKILLENFPEVLHVVSKIGTAEVPTDPMAIEDADIMILLKDKAEWTSASDREELIEKMKEKLNRITWASYEFTQPIQLRFNELMTGAKADISVKIFGENIATLKEKADEAALLIESIDGASDVKVDQTEGLQQLSVRFDRSAMARYGISVNEINRIIRTAYAGEKVGDVFEEERKFDLVVRLNEGDRQTLDLSALTVRTVRGDKIPMDQFAYVESTEGPMMISREEARRFINIGVNVRNRDVGSLVEEISETLNAHLTLPPSYEIRYGGQFENLQHARQRLAVALPLALGLILLLLYFAFGSMVESLIIFMAVPFSAIGGILALAIRDMPFSISSGVGFIALFGVSVLNGIVLISAVRDLQEHSELSLIERLKEACLSRFRPVLMTALVAAMGFLPMAISTGSGAEVQRPLATVVIGGLLTSTILTLLVLPSIYYIVRRPRRRILGKMAGVLLWGFVLIPGIQAQQITKPEDVFQYLEANNPEIVRSGMVEEQHKLNTGAIGQWDPLTIQYQGGQINFPGFDHWILVEQDVSPLLSRKLQFTTKDVIRKEVSLLGKENKWLVHQLQNEVRILFNELAYWHSKIVMQDSVRSILQQLQPVFEIRYDKGAIDVLEHELFRQEVARLNNATRAMEQERIDIEWQIRKLALVPDSVVIIPRQIDQMVPSDTISLQGDTALLDGMYQARTQVLESRIRESTLRGRQLQFRLGYFYQSLEKIGGYQGFQVTMGVPLDQRTEKMRREQLHMEKQQAWLEWERRKNWLDQHIQALKSALNDLLQSMKQYEEDTVESRSRLINVARQRLEMGEIDFLTFQQTQRLVIDQQHEYLELIRIYNQKMIELKYLSTLN